MRRPSTSLGLALQHHVDGLGAVVELALRECDLRQQAPGRHIVRGLGRNVGQDLLGLVPAAEQEVEVRKPRPRRRSNRRQVRRDLQLTLGLRVVALGEVEIGQRAMRLDGLGFLAHRSAQVALGGDGIVLPQIERGEDDQGLGLTRQILADLFQAGDDAVDLLRGSCHARQEEERLEVLGIPLQNGLGLVAGLVGLGAEQIDRAELLSDLEVVRRELLGAEQSTGRLAPSRRSGSGRGRAGERRERCSPRSEARYGTRGWPPDTSPA